MLFISYYYSTLYTLLQLLIYTFIFFRVIRSLWDQGNGECEDRAVSSPYLYHIPLAYYLYGIIAYLLDKCISSRSGIPQPPGHRPVLVHGLLGTGPHGRRWAAGKRAKLHLLLPIACITTWTIVCITTWTIPTPGPWKKCLPWSRSLVPKTSGTTDLDGTRTKPWNRTKTLTFQARQSFAVGTCPVHCDTLSNIPGLSSLDTTDNIPSPILTTPKCLQTLQMSPGVAKSRLIENHWARKYGPRVKLQSWRTVFG